MDDAVIGYYRSLLKEDFPHAGEIANPSAFVEAVGERLINCGNTGNYMQLFLRVSDHRIADIRYLCSCEPAANVAVEVLCTLVKGKTLDEIATLNEESFFQRVGSREEPFAQKVRGILALFHEALTRCRNSGNEQGEDRKEGLADGQLTWDRSYSA